MKCETRYIVRLLSGMLLLLLSACSSSETELQVEEQPTVITFYVYPSDSPMPTRAGDDLVNTIAHENDIKSLQIWVFTHDDGKLVGYLSPTVMPTAEGTVYQMEVSKEFANAAPDKRPNVDIYVAANTAAAGLSFNGVTTTRAELENAKIGTNYFGVTSLYTTIDTEKGLPMSGVLLDQRVVGQNPVLRIGDYDNMAKVQLQRAVSKVRFVFCMQQGTDQSETPTITGITLDGGIIPEEEYLFLGSDGHPYRIGNDYESSAATLLSSTIIPRECDDPSKYIYDSQVFTTAQAYEVKINEGVYGTPSEPDHKELAQVGPFYFRETNRKISGSISYKVGSETRARDPKAFSMVAENGFTRNHSWIVYVYYGADGLDVLTVYVKEWTTATLDHSVYNW